MYNINRTNVLTVVSNWTDRVTNSTHKFSNIDKIMQLL